MTVLDHVGIAVRDAVAAARFYETVLGLQESGRETLAAQGVKVCFVPAGESRIELLEPTDAAGPVARFIDSRGEGLHHIAFRVPDVKEALGRAREAGFALIDQEPRTGAGGAKIAFVHPKSLHGVLVELCEHGGHG